MVEMVEIVGEGILCVSDLIYILCGWGYVKLAYSVTSPKVSFSIFIF